MKASELEVLVGGRMRGEGGSEDSQRGVGVRKEQRDVKREGNELEGMKEGRMVVGGRRKVQSSPKGKCFFSPCG